MDADTLKVLRGFCAELGSLRDDIYNAAVIQNAGAFADIATGQNSKNVAIADMPPQSTAVAAKAWENKALQPVVVFMRAGPVRLVSPPSEMVLAAAVLLLDTDANFVTLPLRASVSHADIAKGVSFLLLPNKTLWYAVMASAAVDVTWFVVPLRGRSAVFGS